MRFIIGINWGSILWFHAFCPALGVFMEAFYKPITLNFCRSCRSGCCGRFGFPLSGRRIPICPNIETAIIRYVFSCAHSTQWWWSCLHPHTLCWKQYYPAAAFHIDLDLKHRGLHHADIQLMGWCGRLPEEHIQHCLQPWYQKPDRPLCISKRLLFFFLYICAYVIPCGTYQHRSCRRPFLWNARVLIRSDCSPEWWFLNKSRTAAQEPV